MTAAVDGSPLEVSDVWALRRDRFAWAMVAVVVVLTGVLAVLLDDPMDLPAFVLFTAIPVAVLGITAALALRCGTRLTTGALAVAVTPAALTAVAGSEPAGGLAVLAACGGVAMAWWGRRAPVIAVVVTLCVAVFALGAWAAAIPDNAAPAPSIGNVVTRTGELLRRSVGALDSITLVPTTGWLIWWVAAGLVAGAALVVGDVVRSAVIPVAATAVVVAGWVLIRWRGSVDISNGTFILSSAVAFTGASVSLDRGADRRVGNTLFGIAAYIWIVTIVHLART